MGAGRRMKKQGPPAPLDESKISSLKKRKPADAEVTVQVGKKRRTDSGDSHAKKKKGASGENVRSVGSAKKNAGVEKPSKKAPPVKLSQPDESESDSSDHDAQDLLGDEFDDIDGFSDQVLAHEAGCHGSSADGEDLGLEEDEFNFNFNNEPQSDDSAFDSEEDEAREKMFSDDEDWSDAEQKLTAANIEGLSRKLDAQAEEEAAAGELELQEAALQTNIAGDRANVFGGDEQLQRQAGLAPDLQLLRTRITETIRILGDLPTLGQPVKSRTDYTNLLISDISTYYGYNPYLAEKLFNLFTPQEAFAFFEANESPRPVVIRTNTLRTNRRSLAQALINRGVVLEPVGKWSKVGLQVFESAVPLGATPEYLAGHYILQAASSFLPVMALAPQPDERILDMAAAPGGKTTYISALMKNTGCVLANDSNKARAKGLIGNIHRLGCKNTIVCNFDARTAFPKTMGGFDRILLDSPCSGTGVISKDPSVKTSKTERDFLALPHMQKQLLLAAIDSVNHASKTGGYVVYSTCSVTVEENEEVVQYALRKRPNVKIVDTGLGNFGSEGFKAYRGKKFDDKMTFARRYFPHRENVDGFFVCKLKKMGPSPASTTDGGAASTSKSGAEVVTAPSGDDDEVVDKTPIGGQDNKDEKDAFGPFNDDEDEEYIKRAERNRLRRKGINPKAAEKGKTDGKEKKAKKAKEERNAEDVNGDAVGDKYGKKVDGEKKKKPGKGKGKK